MNPSFFLACGLGFLWFWQEKSAIPSPRRAGAWARGFLLRAVFVTAAGAFFLGAYHLLKKELPDTASLYPLFFLLAAYLVQLLLRAGDLSGMTLFGLCASHAGADWTLPQALFSLAAMTAGVFLFACLLLGVHRRLLYSAVPASFRGLPISFLGAAFLALAAWGFYGILS